MIQTKVLQLFKMFFKSPDAWIIKSQQKVSLKQGLNNGYQGFLMTYFERATHLSITIEDNDKYCRIFVITNT